MKISYAAIVCYRPPEAAWPGWRSFAEPPASFEPEIGSLAMEQGLAAARLADELGFDWVSVSEHHYGPFTLSPNPMVWAAALSQHVKRARIALLGPIAAINNPVRVAEEIAMLDTLTNGRVLGLFLRGTPNEFATYFVHPGDTKERTQEASLLVKRALTESRPFGWEGKHFRYRHVAVWPRTVQRPHPPLFFSGNTFESATFAARHGFGLAISFVGPPYIRSVLQHYREEAARHGWEPTRDHVIWRHWAVVGESDEEVRRTMASFFGAEGPPFIPPPPAGSPDPAHTIHEVAIAGTPDVVAGQLEELHDLGVGVADLVLSFGYTDHPAVLGAIDLLGRHVLPRVRALGEQSPSVI